MQGVENTLTHPEWWSAVLTNGLRPNHKSRNHVACSTPNKSSNHSGKQNDLQWSSSPVLKNERILCSGSPPTVITNQPSVEKKMQNQHSLLRKLDFEMESSDDDLILTRRITKRTLPADLKNTNIVRSKEYITNERLNKNTPEQSAKSDNMYSTIKRVTSVLPKEDISNIYFEVESSDEDCIPNVGAKTKVKKKRIREKKVKKSSKENSQIQSKLMEKDTGTGSAFELSEPKSKTSKLLVMQRKKRAAEEESNKSVSHNARLSLSKTQSHVHEADSPEEHTEVAKLLVASISYSVPSQVKKSQDLKSPESNTLEGGLVRTSCLKFSNNQSNLQSKRVSFSLSKKLKSPINVNHSAPNVCKKKNIPRRKLIDSTTTMTGDVRERRRSRRPKATPTAYWLGERPFYKGVEDSPLDGIHNEDKTSTDDDQEIIVVSSKRQKAKGDTNKNSNTKPRNTIKKVKKPTLVATERRNSSTIQTACLPGITIDELVFCSDEEDVPNGALFARSLSANSMESGFIKLPAGAETGSLFSTEYSKFYTVLENTVALKIDGITKDFDQYGQFHVNKDVDHKIMNNSSTSTSLLQYVKLLN